MPIFAGIIGSVFTWLTSLFVIYLTKKAAMVTAAIVAISALLVTLVALFTTLLATIVAAAPSGSELAFSLLPSNTTPCLAAYSGSVIAKWAYDWNVKVIQYSFNF